MYIKKPSYGSDPLRKVSSFGSRRSENDDYGYNDSPREERRRRSHRSNADYDDEDIPPRRLRSVGRSKSRRDRDAESHRERRREHRDRGDRSERSEKSGRDKSERSHRDRGHRDYDDEDDSRSHRESRKKSSSRSKSGHGGSSSSKPKATSSSKSKVVIPTNVTYRPGRIQTLTADEEIVFKQIWATILKYCGFELNFDVSDIQYKDCFVASSISTANTDSSGLSRTATRNSLQSATSGKTASSKKKKGLFGGGSSAPAKEDLKPPPDSRRMREIQTQSSSELYEATDYPDDDVINLYSNFYKIAFDYDPDYVSDDDDDFDDDVQSIESFVTASTTITYPDDFPTAPTARSSGKKGGSSLVKAVASSPVTPHAEVDANLARMKPRDVLLAYIKAARADLADNFLLRFVRARKWNTENAIKMFSNSIIWRNDFPANDWVMEGDGPSYLHGKNKGLIKNFTAEKSWIRGEDKGSNPIFWFLAKKHFGADSPSDETQRYAVVTIEWCRLFLKEITESKDTVSIVFDLTGFTLKNADYTTIKFLADVFEAHYPECLGRIYVHNAPWIFSTVWNIIKNWLDPVVASKIVFTKNFQDLSGYINPDFIPVELGGIDTSGPEYNVPKAGDDVPPKRKDATYRRLKLERDEIYMRFFTATKKWIESTNPEVSSEYLREKISINYELSNNYLQLDPYIRNPGPYDRNGLLHIAN